MARIVHLISEFSAHEAMGRTITETVERTPGSHCLVTTKVHDGGEIFDQIVEVGGSLETFPARKGLSGILARLAPDLVHVHGGALSPLIMARTATRFYPTVLTMYAWPVLPRLKDLRRAGLQATRDSNVLKPRVLATTGVPPGLVARAIRRANVRAVLTPDPSVQRRLSGRVGIPVLPLESGGVDTTHRASFNDANPEIVFAGRAETVRGIDTLVDAFGQVVCEVPKARLRLLLIPRPELPKILNQVAESPASESIDVSVEPVADLLAEFAQAQVGCWPFKFDYTTSPPAMALVEAMSVGLPVVSTQVACVESAATDGRGARLVPPMSPDDLAPALTAMLRNQTEWHRQARLARQSAMDRTWSKAAQVTRNAYARVLPGEPEFRSRRQSGPHPGNTAEPTTPASQPRRPHDPPHLAIVP